MKKLGLQTRPGWTGYLMFYRFRCPACACGLEEGEGLDGR